MQKSPYDEVRGIIAPSATILHRLRDWFGTQFEIYMLGEETPESLVLTAGLRGECRDAVYAISRVTGEISVSKKAYIAPTLDPTGFNGIHYILSRIGGTAVVEKCPSNLSSGAVEIYKAGNLAAVFPIDNPSDTVLVQRVLDECGMLEKLEGLYVAASSQPENTPPAAIYHVERGRLYRLDEWKDAPPGHVGDVLSVLNELSPTLYVELGCLQEGGVEIIYSGGSGSIEDIISIASIQLEEELGIQARIINADGESLPSFHRVLVERGLGVIRIGVAPHDWRERCFRLAALSLINSFAFFTI